ncbi:MAG: hypothetical protein WAL95_06865 [Candidatus Acidiferrales bacterium]
MRFFLRTVFTALCLAIGIFILTLPANAQDTAPETAPTPPAAPTAAPAPAVVPVAATTAAPATPAAAPPSERLVLKEGTEVPLVFASALDSKTAVDEDSVNMTLAEDLKVGDVVVVKKGAPAVATVTNAKKAGMMGRPGELSIRLEYVKSDDQRLHLRGAKGKEGEGKVGATVALTVIFGPIGLIKHGKNVVIPAGAPLTAYVDQDYTLAPVK